MHPPSLILASQSPRRRQLLEAVGLAFRIELPTADEETPRAVEVDAVTLRNSKAKAESILARVPSQSAIVVAADTLVVLGDEVLGKPASREVARAMLRRLAGNTHRVVTGLTLLSGEHGCHQVAESSFVTFRELGTEEVERYLETREPYDKAGSYAVQGLGALFIERIEGSYTNVMGLPVEALLRGLGVLCGRPVFDWFLP